MSDEPDFGTDEADEPEESPDLVRMAGLLPSWMTERMLNDVWYFGLMLTTGKVLCISCIKAVHQAADGSIWLDVELLGSDELINATELKPFYAPTTRLDASVNAAHVVAAFELADT